MSDSRRIGSSEPTTSMFMRSWPQVSMRIATLDSLAADSKPCNA